MGLVSRTAQLTGPWARLQPDTKAAHRAVHNPARPSSIHAQADRRGPRAKPDLLQATEYHARKWAPGKGAWWVWRRHSPAAAGSQGVLLWGWWGVGSPCGQVLQTLSFSAEAVPEGGEAPQPFLGQRRSGWRPGRRRLTLDCPKIPCLCAQACSVCVDVQCVHT